MPTLHALKHDEVEVLSLATRHPIFRGDGSADTATLLRLAELGYLKLDEHGAWVATVAGQQRLTGSERQRGRPRATA